ncbi:MAG: NUDIX domain-containing protein [Planctomycetes bacterium]|nr:NUDIX domain-containing protein [Planctomycetota bacterium]
MANEVQRQAGAVVYRTGPWGGLEVLLVSRSTSGWGFPKGGIKRSQSATIAARAEALEEAGVLGRIDPLPLGSYRYRKRRLRRHVVVYAMRAERLLERWDEEQRRTRVWVPLREASRMLASERARPLLDALKERLRQQRPHTATLRLAA